MLDQFLDLLRTHRGDRLRALDLAFDRAFKDGDDAALATLRLQRRALLDLPASIVDGARAELVAQWPADFPPIPAWFADPDSVGPLGEECVVDCAPPKPAPPADAEAPAVEPDLEAQILATRAARAKDEDEARRIGIENGRRVLPADLGLA